MKPLKILLSVAALAAALAVSAPALAGDADARRHLMMAQFDRLDSRLTVEPITVHEDVAVAGWAQGDMGGRALLRRKDGKWSLALCSGDALKEAGSLQQFGLNAVEAEALAKAVIEAETKVDPALVAKFSTFDGVMMMDEDGHHPTVGAQSGNHG